METKRLDEIGTIITGTTPDPSILSSDALGGIPFLTPSDFQHRSVHPVTERFLPNNLVEKLSRKLVPPGTTAVTCIGATIGKTTMMKSMSLTNQQINSVIPNSENDHRFIYYSILTVVDHLVEVAGGSATPILNKTAFSSIRIPVFPTSLQSDIAMVLGSLDDKIAANIEAVRTIDRLRNALWQRNLEDGATAAPLSSLASFVNGGAFTKNATGTGRVVVRISEMNSGIGNNTVRNELDVPETKVVRPGELLFSWSGTLMTKRWPYDEAIVNQHIFKVIPDHGFPLAFLDCAIEQQLNFFRMIATGKATTMGHIKRSDLDVKVQIPTQFREEDLRLVESLWANASALEKENITLAKTRDELLPLLMSGKITVREASQEAAAAGAQIPSEENEV